MKYDTIIIGGGLAGLVAGLRIGRPRPQCGHSVDGAECAAFQLRLAVAARP